MQQTSSDMSVWVRFFKDASIPSQYIQNYAIKFTENRIRFDMLADLDRQLLNEMGITAIGDCLSILKHAKTINSRIDEKNKELGTTNDPSLYAKKRSEVAKRIIETYLSDPDAKPLNEKSNLSTLSADLISRLNFNPNTTQQLQQQAMSKNGTIVTFNEDSLHSIGSSSTSASASKVIVSSTTNDDDFLHLRKNLKLKRKISDVYDNVAGASSPSNDLDETLSDKDGSVLEYRGLLKTQKPSPPPQQPQPPQSRLQHKIINLKKPAQQTKLHQNEPINKSIKSRLYASLSETANATNATTSAKKTIVTLNKNKFPMLRVEAKLKEGQRTIQSISSSSDDMDTDTTSFLKRPTLNSDIITNSTAQSVSVFKRLKMNDSTQINTNKLPIQQNSVAVKRIFNEIAATAASNLKMNNKYEPSTTTTTTTTTFTRKTKITPITLEPTVSKPKIIPITLEKTQPTKKANIKPITLSKSKPAAESKIISLNKSINTKKALINRISF